MPYTALQQSSDDGFPSGRLHYWKAGFCRHLPPEAIDVVLRAVSEAPSPYTGIGFQQMTGVASRVPPAATAFGHRAQQYDCLILSQWDRPADSDDNIAWTRGVFTALSPYLETWVEMMARIGSGRLSAPTTGASRRSRQSTIRPTSSTSTPTSRLPAVSGLHVSSSGRNRSPAPGISRGRACRRRSLGRPLARSRAFAPTQTCICAHSTGHVRPLGRAFAPTRPDICARSSLHLRPVGRTFAPARRRGGVSSAGPRAGAE
jgi:hypothetical protein